MAANFWEKDAIVKSEDKWWEKDAVVGSKEEAPKDKGFFSNIGELAVEGGQRAIGSAKVSPSVISGNVGPEQAGVITEQLGMKPAVQPKELTEVQGAFKDEAEAWKKAQGFTESVSPFIGFVTEFGKQALTNPKGVAYMTAQSAANMAPSIAGMIAGGKMGSVLGPYGALGGAMVGGFAGEAPLEIGAEFIDNVGKELKARDLDPTKENVEAILKDRAFVSKAVSESRTKGATTAAVDSLMTAGAGRVATAPRRAAIKAAQTELGATADAAKIAARADEILKEGTRAERAARTAKQGAKAVGLDVAGGGLSEAAGQYAAYGEVDPESVLLEMLGELGGSAIEVPSAAYATGRDALKAKAKKDAAKILEEERAATKQAEEPVTATQPQAPAETTVTDIEDLEKQFGMAPAPAATMEDVIKETGEPVAEPAAEPAPVVPEAPKAVAQEPAPEVVAEPETPAAQPPKAADLAREQDFSSEYDTPEQNLRESDAFGQDLLSMVKGELDNYGRAAVKNRKLTEKFGEMSDAWAAAADAAKIAFARNDYEAFKPYEQYFRKTAKVLQTQIAKNIQLIKDDEKALAEMQKPLTAAEEMEGVPAPREESVEAEVEKLTKDQEAAIAEREKLEKRTAGTSLIKVLKGTLNDGELSELGGRARKVGKNPFLNLKASKGQVGSSIDDMVESGRLDLFLPEKMRPEHPDYVNSESAEYIREKLRNNQFYTYDTELAIQRANQDIEYIERRIQELLSDDEINKELQYAADEQRELDQAAQEPAAPEADRDTEQRETKATDDDLDKREAQLDREAALNEREAKLLEERKRLEEERLKLESPTKEQVVEEEERKTKAAELDEKEQIRKESEAGAGQFELTREEGRQDTTGDIFNQPEPEAEPEPAVVAISPEQERKEALEQLKKNLGIWLPPFRSRGGDNKVVLIKPTALKAPLLKEIMDLAEALLDLGFPAAILKNVKAAGVTRTKAEALMTDKGWLLIGSQWKDDTREEKIHVIAHELGHSVDNAAGVFSQTPAWEKAHRELQSFYENSQKKNNHPFSYPFAPRFKGRVRIEMESFAQAFGYYFTNPVDLQKNAPEAYSQIQSVVERIQNESEAARAAGTTAAGTAGIKIQPSKTAKAVGAQPQAGAERVGISGAARLEDRGAGKVKPAQFYEDIPNESWLQGKIEYAQRSPRNDFGVPKMSSVTGYFSKPVLVPVRWFDGVKGERGEQDNVRSESLNGIRKVIRETGKFPLTENGTEYVPYIEIGYDGKPWISEGNHRVMAAIAEGMDYIPVELRYFDGGQRRAGKWNPENILEITDRKEQEINAMERADQTETPAFKRWFGESLVVNKDGTPKVVYRGEHGDTDAQLQSRRGSISFGTKEIANVYAETPNDHGDFTALPRVTPAYLRIENPLINTPNDPFIELGDVIDKLGQDVAEAAAMKFYNDIYESGAWYRDYDGKYEGIVDLVNKNPDGLRGLYVYAYKFFDDPDFVSAAKKAGYDGAIHAEYGFHSENEEGAEYKVFDEKQVKSAIGNRGTFDPEVQDINASVGQNIFGEPVLGSWTQIPDTKLIGDLGKDDVIYKLQDKLIDTKRVVQAITNQVGKIATQWNPYLQEELYHGRTAKETNDFLSKELRPLMQQMDKDGITIGEFEQYLHNRHAEAYNRQVAKVNPNDPDMQDGGSGIATKDAQEYLANLPADKKAQYEALAKKLDAITKGTRELLVKSGLETKDAIDAWEKVFPDYVPLQREEEDFQYITSSTGTGRGFDVRGPFSRRAMGSKRKVVDILANVALQRENAIVKANKNRVAVATYGLAIQQPNPDFWLAINPEAEKVPEAALEELRALGIDDDAINFLMKEPRQRSVDPKKNEVMSRINAVMRNNASVLSARVNGQNRYVFFNPNNDQAARAASALKNLDADQLGNILGTISKITRWMASVNTQYNPIFGAYNFLRDTQGAALQLSDTPLAGKQKEVLKNSLPALSAIYSAIRGERKGKQVDTEMAKLWEDFQKAGGQTGFRDMYSRSQERSEALQKELRQLSSGKVVQIGRAMRDWLSDYNDTMENAVRLAAYKTALDNGISRDEAASIAKNLTVNFNRKGQIATQAGALYAFFNAGVQGTTRLVQTMTGPAGRKIMAGGLLWGAMQASLLAMAGFDDEEPPEFVRERNFIIPTGWLTGKKDYVTFPMPLGYHVIPGTSRILTEWAMSGFKDTPERLTSLTGMYLDAFNPIGNAGWSVQTIAPTFADPLVALAENKDWTGKPIAKKDFSGLDPTPGYTRAKDAATWYGTQIAKFLNFASGGTKYQPGVISPTPDQIDYLIGQATGGVGRELGKLATTVEKKYTGEDLPAYKIPVVGRFYGEATGSAAEASRFYKNLERINKLDNEIKGRKENHEPLGDFLSENPEARLAKRGREIQGDIKKLKERKAKLLERNAPRESIKVVEEQITRKHKLFNDQVASFKK